MKRSTLAAAVAAAAALAASWTVPAHAQATVGQPAPAFTATDAAGKTVNLADFKGMKCRQTGIVDRKDATQVRIMELASH